MSKSKGMYIVALTQLILAWSSTRRWLLTGDGVDLVFAVICGLLTILCVCLGYKARNSPPWPKSDPQALRRIARVAGATGTLALLVLLWRVRGEWILLGGTTNLVLAMFCILGLGYGISAALLLRGQREP